MRAGLVLLMLWGCVNSQHAEVRLGNNPAGADCFSRCVNGATGIASVDCVASCPGGMRADGDCASGGLSCVEERKLSTGKTAVLVIGAVIVVALIAGTGGGGGSGP